MTFIFTSHRLIITGRPVDEKLLGGFAALISAVPGIGSLLLGPSPSSALGQPVSDDHRARITYRPLYHSSQVISVVFSYQIEQLYATVHEGSCCLRALVDIPNHNHSSSPTAPTISAARGGVTGIVRPSRGLTLSIASRSSLVRHVSEAARLSHRFGLAQNLPDESYKFYDKLERFRL